MREKLVFYEDSIAYVWKYVKNLCFNETGLHTLDSKENVGFVQICNSFCFWYNKVTKRVELELDSDVDRWKDGG